jgi:serine/threonine protein kinase
VEDLGKGAHGYVDRVVSTVSHKEYARKLIPRGRTFQRDQKVLRDFERELGTLKKLRHRHIVRLVGSYTDPRFVGIVMSPVAECDLKDFLNSCTSHAPGKFSQKSLTRSFFGCLTSALSYLHDNTIRHKDIKPQNVLVSQHTVYLTDFGISLDWSEIGRSTTTGPTPRTERYCAPEVSENAPRNTSSDMWSLGCIFLEIWSVLKGESIANLHAFLEANGTLSSCYHLNSGATFDWMRMLEAQPNLSDNPPQEWIYHLLVEDKKRRWTARDLLSEIDIVNSNPNFKFAFSGQCCIEELESAESILASDGSIYETAAGDFVPQPPPPVAPRTHAPVEDVLPKPPCESLTTQHNIAMPTQQQNSSHPHGQYLVQNAKKRPGRDRSHNQYRLSNVLLDSHSSVWTIEKSPHAESWVTADLEEYHIPMVEIHERIARFKRQGDDVAQILLGIKPQSARRAVVNLVGIQNEHLWEYNPTIQFVIASVELDKRL